MQPVNCIALFCEDIREEQNGVLTLIGIIPDNVNVATIPVGASGQLQPDPSIKMLAKLCIYVRVNFDPDYDLREAKMRLVPPEGTPIELGAIDSTTIGKARSEAKEKSNLLAGVVSRAVLGGFPLPKTGTLKLELAFGDEVRLAGALQFQQEEKTLTPTSSSVH